MEKYKKEQYNLDVETNNLEQFPEDLLEKRDIVVLGETAHGEHYKTMLHFLDKFGSQINRVFIELPTNYQDSVDKYFTTGEVDEKLEDLFDNGNKSKSVMRNKKNTRLAKVIKNSII